MTMAYIKVMVDLKVGLMFIGFFKLPLKVPSNTENGNFLKAKQAHYLLCDSKGAIQSISHNCMKNLGIPPSVVSKSKNELSTLTQIE